MSDQIIVFNRKRKNQQLNRAAKRFSYSDFLYNESADRLSNQFDELIKKNFDTTLNIGAKAGYLSQTLAKNKNFNKIIETETSLAFLKNSKTKNLKIQADEEFLPFKDESFDLIISNLSLHWVNDLPGCLIQIKRCLKKGGFFCANLFGGKTLQELRNAMIIAEQEGDKASPRISPFIDVRDGASLLQRVNFNEPVSVSENIIVKYNSAYEILKDLRNMGETNALMKLNSKYPGKKYFDEVDKIYQKNFSDDSGNINATFEIVTISGWKK